MSSRTRRGRKQTFEVPALQDPSTLITVERRMRGQNGPILFQKAIDEGAYVYDVVAEKFVFRPKGGEEKIEWVPYEEFLEKIPKEKREKINSDIAVILCGVGGIVDVGTLYVGSREYLYRVESHGNEEKREVGIRRSAPNARVSVDKTKMKKGTVEEVRARFYAAERREEEKRRKFSQQARDKYEAAIAEDRLNVGAQ